MRKLFVVGASALLALGLAAGAVAQDAVVELSPDQQTTVIKDFSTIDVKPVPSVDFDVTAGAVVPNTVVLEPVPDTIVKVVPKYAKYKFFRVADGRIVIVEPSTMKVVTVLK